MFALSEERQVVDSDKMFESVKCYLLGGRVPSRAAVGRPSGTDAAPRLACESTYQQLFCR